MQITTVESLLHLKQIAINRGYQARVKQIHIADLAHLDRPIVVHLTIDGKYGHFAVLREVTDDGWVRLSDPSRGMVWLPVDKFVLEWNDPEDKCTVEGQSGHCALFIYRAGYEPYQRIFRKTNDNWNSLQGDAVRSFLFR